MSVYTKLNQARNQFHTLKLKKSGLNKFAGYEYFELADFLIPAMNVLSKNELCAFISFGKELATMKIVDTTDNTSIEITSPMSTAALKGCHEVQNLGAVQSYLRRYLWVAALEIVEHDALDSSKPITDEPRKVIKQGAKDGIGDDLPDEWKTYLLNLAGEVSNWVLQQNNPAKAKAIIDEAVEVDQLDGDMIIFMERHLDSKVRSALRKIQTV